MNIENALRRLVPEPQFYGRLFTQDDYNKIQWVDSRFKPTWEEIVAADALNGGENEAKIQAFQAETTNLNFVKAHPRLRAFLSLSPQEVEAWIENNVTNLASAKETLKLICLVLHILAKKL